MANPTRQDLLEELSRLEAELVQSNVERDAARITVVHLSEDVNARVTNLEDSLDDVEAVADARVLTEHKTFSEALEIYHLLLHGRLPKEDLSLFLMHLISLDATNVVEAAKRAGIEQPLSNDPSLEEQILAELQCGRSISAIKMYREVEHVGLREAKDAVEAMGERSGILSPHSPPSSHGYFGGV